MRETAGCDPHLNRRYAEASSSDAFARLCRYAQHRPGIAFDMLTGAQIALAAQRLRLIRYKCPQIAHVIDLCCGSGASLREVLDTAGGECRDMRLTGCDVCEGAVALARTSRSPYLYTQANAGDPSSVIAASVTLQDALAEGRPVCLCLLDGPEGVEILGEMLGSWRAVLPAQSRMMVFLTAFAADGAADTRCVQRAFIPGLPPPSYSRDLSRDEQEVWKRMASGLSRFGADMHREGLGWLADEIADAAADMRKLRPGTDYRRWYLDF